MSWSEIKKAVNSDLNTPLNKLLKNYFGFSSNVMCGTVSGSLTTSYQTFLEVSGSGIIYNAYALCAVTQGTQLRTKITLDGEVILNTYGSSTANSGARTIASGIKGIPIFSGDGEEYNLDIDTNYPLSDRHFFIGASSELVNKSYSSSTGVSIIIPTRGMRFEKSLKIEVSSNASQSKSCYCFYDYILDD